MFPSGPHNPLRSMPLHHRLMRLGLPMAAVLCLGTAGYTHIEGWSIEQSIYFTIITFTTVGYNDYDLSLMGQRFTAVIIILGFGVFTYVLSQVMQIVVERQLDWERVMQRKIQSISDHFIIVGFGGTGKIVCERLHEENVPFVVVDRDRELVEEAAHIGYLAVVSDATNDDDLEACRIRHARGLVCLTTSDANNIVITLSARALCPELNIISRAETDDHARKLRHAGATRVISPTHAGAMAIANTIVRPYAIDFLHQTTGDHNGLEFSKIAVGPDTPLDGRTVASAIFSSSSALLIVAVQRPDGTSVIAPKPEHLLAAGDTLIVAGHPGAVVGFCVDAA